MYTDKELLKMKQVQIKLYKDLNTVASSPNFSEMEIKVGSFRLSFEEARVLNMCLLNIFNGYRLDIMGYEPKGKIRDCLKYIGVRL